MSKQLKLEDFEKKLTPEWFKYMKDYIASEEMYELFQKLKQDSKKDKIYPESKNTFRCFSECKPENLKLIIFAQDPYPGEYYSTKAPHATGLCLDNVNSPDGKLQGSLSSFWKGISNEYETDIDEYLTKDLSFLSTQGVMLTNRSLTVKKGKMGSHQTYWDGFWKYFLETVIASYFPSIPFLFLGKESLFLKRYIFEMSNPLWSLEHPSAANKTQSLWETKNTFHKINQHIAGTIGDRFEIEFSYKKYKYNLESCPF